MFFAEWFPTPLLKDTLEPSEEVRAGMLNYINTTSDRLNDDKTYFGDTAGTSALHKQEPFDWLNKEVGRCAEAYLEKMGCNIDSINIYIQKSWCVVLTGGGSVFQHKHKNSVLSAVYYLQVPSVSGGGRINFWSGNPIHDLAFVTNDSQVISASSFHDVPKQDTLILFPSNLTHSVSPYDLGDTKRISISYDITPCFKDEAGSNEHWIIDPSHWTKV